MKLISSIVIVICIVFGTAPKCEYTSTLTVRVDGLRNNNGYISVAIYSDSDDFLGDEPTYSKEVEADDSTIEIVFEELESGTYSIAVMHDENGNGELDTNEYGMPTEGFGFSNEADASMGPPSLEAASFEVEGATEEYVEMIYLGGH